MTPSPYPHPIPAAAGGPVTALDMAVAVLLFVAFVVAPILLPIVWGRARRG